MFIRFLSDSNQIHKIPIRFQSDSSDSFQIPRPCRGLPREAGHAGGKGPVRAAADRPPARNTNAPALPARTGAQMPAGPASSQERVRSASIPHGTGLPDARAGNQKAPPSAAFWKSAEVGASQSRFGSDFHGKGPPASGEKLSVPDR